MARTVRVTWQGRPVDAAAPARIAALEPRLSVATARRTERAAAAVRRADDRASGVLEVSARLLLRAEGLASSAIEGLRSPTTEVALAEAIAIEGEGEGATTAGWVADNLAVVSDALAEPGPISIEHLLGWHARLMRHADLPAEFVGRWRDRLGWVGGASPLIAAHVAVPHRRIPGLMDDLVAFVARRDIDAITQAAVAHAQFETIHPFADGNGRLGRVLIGRILADRLEVAIPPPLSTAFARDVGGYQSGLTLFRQGQVETWVSWFATAVETAADRSRDVLDAVAALHREWRESTADLRADSAARRLVELIPAHPALSARSASGLLGVSTEAARLALEHLADRGIVEEVPAPGPPRPGRPRRWWVAPTLLALVSG